MRSQFSTLGDFVFVGRNNIDIEDTYEDESTESEDEHEYEN